MFVAVQKRLSTVLEEVRTDGNRCGLENKAKELFLVRMKRSHRQTLRCIPKLRFDRAHRQTQSRKMCERIATCFPLGSPAKSSLIGGNSTGVGVD